MSLRRGLNQSPVPGLDVATKIRQCLADRPVREQAEFDFSFEPTSYAPLSIALRTAAHGEALREAAQRPEARVASIDHYFGSVVTPQTGIYAAVSARLVERGCQLR